MNISELAQNMGMYGNPASAHRRCADTTSIPAEVLFARDFVQDHQVMARPIAFHGEDCGYITPDTMPGQDFAVGAAYDLMYGYFMQAQQKLRYPSPLDDPDDDEEDEEFEEEVLNGE